MQIRKTTIIITLILFSRNIFGWDAVSYLEHADQEPLNTTYTKDKKVCDIFYDFYIKFTKCALTDEICYTKKWIPENEPNFQKVNFSRESINTYGYTSMSLSDPRGNGISYLYLNNFNGDRHARLLETWKVNTFNINNLLNLDIPPVPDNIPSYQVPVFKKNIYRDRLQKILGEGEKLSDDWSPVFNPIFILDNVDYAVTRECAGNWEYGAFYDCDKILKITVKRISSTKKFYHIANLLE